MWGARDNPWDTDVLVAEGLNLHISRNDHDNGDFLNVRLAGKGKNLDGIGASIAVHDAGYLGDPLHMRGYRQVIASSNDQRPLVQHFGLPCADRYDVRVKWPGGQVTDQPTVLIGKTVTISQ